MRTFCLTGKFIAVTRLNITHIATQVTDFFCKVIPWTYTFLTEIVNTLFIKLILLNHLIDNIWLSLTILRIALRLVISSSATSVKIYWLELVDDTRRISLPSWPLAPVTRIFIELNTDFRYNQITSRLLPDVRDICPSRKGLFYQQESSSQFSMRDHPKPRHLHIGEHRSCHIYTEK